MSTLLLLLVLHGLFLAGLLALAGRRRDPANGILAALVALASLLLFEAWLVSSGTTVAPPYLRGLLRSAWLLVGPLTLVYVRRFVGLPARRADALLGIPFLLAGAWTVLYLGPFGSAGLPRAWGPHGQAGMLVLCTVFWVLTAGCAWHSLTLVRRRRRKDPDRFASVPWRVAWLRLLLGALAVYAALDAVTTVTLFAFGGYPPGVGVASVVVLASILYGVGLLVTMPDGLLSRAPWPGRSYERSEIPSDVAQRHLDRLEALMEEKRPWLDDGLGLDDLAARAGMTRHHLSQLLSQYAGASFPDYVNGYRIAEAKRLLRDAGSTRSVLDIGLEAGFGSSSTFYRAFKKHVGTTPREYLREAAVSSVEPLASRRRGTSS